MNHEEMAIRRIQEFAPRDEAYWGAFSGGKDSQVIADLLRRSGVNYELHLTLTGLDAPISIRFVKQYYPEVIVDRVEKNIKQICVDHQMLPNRKARFCCEYLKERGGINRFVVTGVRWQESAKRKKRLMYEPSRTVRKRFLHPIIDWKNDQVWKYMYDHHLPINPLYLPPYNYKRIGCLGCPMSHKQGRDFQFFPASRKIWLGVIASLLTIYPNHPLHKIGDAERVLAWWMSKQSIKTFSAQGCLFFE